MFGLFKAKPPLSPWEKAWTEHRFRWFTDQLGLSSLLEVETLSVDDPRIPSLTSVEQVEELVQFLAGWMRYDLNQVNVQVFGQTVGSDQLQRIDEGQVTVQVHESQVGDREQLVASLARQLAREMLVNGPLHDAKRADLQWTTDLLPAFLGLGVFAANTPLREPEKEPSHFAWWGKRQRTYLPSRVFGYAMALRSFVRDEAVDGYADSLRPDAQAAVLDGRKYLDKTDDTTYSRDSARQDVSRLANATFHEALRAGSPSRQISAMWELSLRSADGNESETQTMSDLLMDCLRSKEPEVRAVAVSTLPLYDRSADAAQELADALRDSSEEVRIAAAGALADYVGIDDETLVRDLKESLKDGERLVVFNAARSLTRYGAVAETALAPLLKRMRQALVECRDTDAMILLATIDSIAGHGKQLVANFFDDSDAEYRDISLELWGRLEANAEAVES